MGAGGQRPGTGARDGARSPPALPRSHQGVRREEGGSGGAYRRSGVRGRVTGTCAARKHPSGRGARPGSRPGGETPVGRCAHRRRRGRTGRVKRRTIISNLFSSSWIRPSVMGDRHTGEGRLVPLSAGRALCEDGMWEPRPHPGRLLTASLRRSSWASPAPTAPTNPYRALGESRRGRSAANRAEGTEASARVSEKSPSVRPAARRRSAPKCDVRPPLAILRRTSAYPQACGRLVGGRRGHRGWGSG